MLMYVLIYTHINSRKALEVVVIPNVVLIIASNASTSGFICIGVIRGEYDLSLSQVSSIVINKESHSCVRCEHIGYILFRCVHYEIC